GAGAHFCQGREVPRPAPGQILSALEAKQIHADPFLSLAAAFERTAAPIVGVIRGQVSGGGCAIAGLCDVTIAAADATFVPPEVHHGIAPCLAMAGLGRRMPRKALVHWVYPADPLDAAAALPLGLVGQVVPPAELDRAADALVKKLLGYAPTAVQA